MKLVKYILFICLFYSCHIVVAQNKSKQLILKTIGDAAKWKSLNYILFSSNSPNNNFLQRSYLIDKQTGKARLDAVTTDNESVVMLFNFKHKRVEKCYINGQLSDLNSLKVPLQEVLNQLFQDTELLFLPMFVISAPKNHIAIKTDQIVNAERLVEVVFQGVSNLNKDNIEGSIYINNKGELKEYIINQEKIALSDIKDIGDGILIPTSFNYANTAKTIKFTTVAAFTDVELSRFSNL